MATTYYEIFIDENERQQQSSLGSEEYGYDNLDAAIKSCPLYGWVQERFVEGGTDWAGNVVYRRTEEESPLTEEQMQAVFYAQSLAPCSR